MTTLFPIFVINIFFISAIFFLSSSYFASPQVVRIQRTSGIYFLTYAMRILVWKWPNIKLSWMSYSKTHIFNEIVVVGDMVLLGQDQAREELTQFSVMINIRPVSEWGDECYPGGVTGGWWSLPEPGGGKDKAFVLCIRYEGYGNRGY